MGSRYQVHLTYQFKRRGLRQLMCRCPTGVEMRLICPPRTAAYPTGRRGRFVPPPSTWLGSSPAFLNIFSMGDLCFTASSKWEPRHKSPKSCSTATHSTDISKTFTSTRVWWNGTWKSWRVAHLQVRYYIGIRIDHVRNYFFTQVTRNIFDTSPATRTTFPPCTDKCTTATLTRCGFKLVGGG